MQRLIDHSQLFPFSSGTGVLDLTTERALHVCIGAGGSCCHTALPTNVFQYAVKNYRANASRALESGLLGPV
jgi:hypothetical protein